MNPIAPLQQFITASCERCGKETQWIADEPCFCRECVRAILREYKVRRDEELSLKLRVEMAERAIAELTMKILLFSGVGFFAGVILTLVVLFNLEALS